MSEDLAFGLPREIRDQIYTEVLQGSKYVLGDDETRINLPKPAYAGLLVASKAISAELQESLYKECVFRVYFNRRSHYLPSPPCRQNFSRVQKLELFLNLRTNTESMRDVWKEPMVYYRHWLEMFGGSRIPRGFCRITISNLIFDRFWYATNVSHEAFCQPFLHPCRAFVGFQTVVLELGESPLPYHDSFHDSVSQGAYYEAGTGPAEPAEYAGEQFEAYKRRLAMELEPTLGHCIYYDRGNFRCLEFRPRAEVPIEPGCEAYVGELED